MVDGIRGPGLTYAEAANKLKSRLPEEHPWATEGYSPYGCNMAFRLSAIKGLRFDKRLGDLSRWAPRSGFILGSKAGVFAAAAALAILRS